MTDETDLQDREDEARPHGETLWADVRCWFGAILCVFGDLRELVQVGLTRSLAVKLCNWLWGVEGAVRRLILAEALSLDPASLGPSRASTGKEPRSRRPGKRRPSFRIFGFIAAGRQDAPSGEDPSPRPGLPARWHIAFPADPLLAIGERQGGRRPALAPGRSNPLDRRGGISHGDPDCWLHREEEDPYAAAFRSRGGGEGRPCAPRPPPVPAQERRRYLFQRSDPDDWRRVEAEWKEVIPAPRLAARIFALSSILQRREAAIGRIARWFERHRTRIADLISQPAPELAWPRHARLIHRSRAAEELVPRSCAVLRRRLDTS